MRSSGLAGLILLLGLFPLLCGCAAQEAGEEALDFSQETAVSSAQELAAFFEAGGDCAVLAADIDLGKAQLSLSAQRGAVELIGGGHTLWGAGGCVVRLQAGAQLTLTDITIDGTHVGVGMLEDGALGGDAVIRGGDAALHAAGAAVIRAGSALAFHSDMGTAVRCRTLLLEEGAEATAMAAGCGAQAAEDIELRAGAKLSCTGQGDNAARADGTLRLAAHAAFTAQNTGEHNGAKAGALAIDPGAAMTLSGGENGVGLFVVEQTEDITIRGSCAPEVRVEFGKGTIVFE